MSQDASAGRLYVEVVGDTSGFGRSIQAKVDAEVARVRARIRTEVDTSNVRREVEAAARAAQGRAVVRLGIDREHLRRNMAAAVTEAAGRITDAKVRVGSQFDSKQLRSDVEGAARDADATVEVDADTSKAERKIDHFASYTNRQAARMAMSIGMAFGKLSLLEGIGNSVLFLAGGLGQVAGGLYSVAAASAPAVGGLVAIPAAIGAAVQGIGTLLLGFAGIGDAVKALSQAQSQAGSIAASSARAQEAAAERVASAQRRLSDAREAAARAAVQAARQVEDAERRLADAQVRSRQAQEALTDAREEAQERLEDLALTVAGAALDEEDAVLAVERARRRLEEQRADDGADPLDLAEADLAYRQALQRLDEVRERNEDLRQEQARANREGVEGSEEVTAAKEAVADAARAERDAERDLTEARQDAARAVRDAARNVSDAQRELAQAQRDAARAGEQQATALNKVNEALAMLSPAGQRFAKFLAGEVLPAIRTLRKEVQEALLPSIENGLRRLLTLLPEITQVTTGTARAIGGLFEEFADMVTSREWREDLVEIGENNARTITNLGRSGLDLIDILRNLLIAADPMIQRFERWANRLTATWRAQVDLNRENGKLEAFFERTADVIGQWARILDNVADAFFNIGKASADAGQGLLDSLEEASAKFEEWTKDHQAELEDFFDEAADTLRIFGDIIVGIVQMLGRLSVHPGTQQFLESASEKLMPAIERLLTALLESGTGEKMIDALVALIDAVIAVVEAGGAEAFFDALTAMLEAFTDFALTEDGKTLLNWILTIAGYAAALSLVGGALATIAGGILRIAGALKKIPGVSAGIGMLGGLLGLGAGAAGKNKTGGGGTTIFSGGPGGSSTSNKPGGGGLLGKIGGGLKGGLAGIAASIGGSLIGGAIGDGKGGARDALGGAISGGASGAAAGGLIGSIVPVIGTTIGAAVGGVLGAIHGAISNSIGWEVLGKKWTDFKLTVYKTTAELATNLRTKWQEIKNNLLTKGGEILADARTKWGEIKNAVLTRGGEILTDVRTKWGEIKNSVLTKGGEILADARTKWSEIKTTVLTKGGEILTDVRTKWGEVKNAVLTKGGEILADARLKWGEIKTAVLTKGGEILTDVRTKWGEIKTGIATKGGEILTDVRTKWGEIKNSVVTKGGEILASAREKFQETKTSVFLKLNEMGTGVASRLKTQASDWGTKFQGMRDSAITWMGRVKDSLTAAKGGIIPGIVAGFKLGVTGIGIQWDTLKKIAATPVNFVIGTVYNKGIVPVWNKVADLVGLTKLKLPIAPLIKFERGGFLPGYAPGRDTEHVMMSKGEGVLVPEAVRGVARMMGMGPGRAIDTINSMFSTRVSGPGRAGIPHFADGGILDKIGSVLSSAKDWVLGGLSTVAKAALAPIKAAITSSLSGNNFSSALGALARKAIDSVISLIGTKDAAAAAKAGVAGRWTGGESPYQRVVFNGKVTNARTAAMLAAAQRLLGHTLSITQGSYSTSVAASGSTHAGGGVVDISGVHATTAVQSALRRVGFAAWIRTPSQGPWSRHIHAVAIGDPSLSASAARQVQSFLAGGTGLGGAAKGGLVDALSMADGGTVPARRGGTLARLAERGRPEAVTDAGLLNARLADLSDVRDLLRQIIDRPLTPISVYPRAEHDEATIAALLSKQLAWEATTT